MVSVSHYFGKLISGVFNISVGEWPKVTVSWFLRFFYRFGFVVGWTALVAMFVSKFGIAQLPYLFVVNGFFTILGSIFYSTFIDRVDRNSLMIGSLFITCALLLLALLIVKDNFVLFFGILVAAESIFLMQFKILANGYTEDLFTATESERAFPLIESADTIGGVLAGLLVIISVEYIQIHNFIYLWVVILLLIVPLLMYFSNLREEISLVTCEKTEKRSPGIITKLRGEFANSSGHSYVRGLFLIVFFYWVSANLLEFQYTKAIYQSVSGVLLQAGSGFEHAFVHDLGKLTILFSASALMVQLFIGGKLINKLGVFGSMLIHPIVSILSFIPLLFSFTFWSAVMVKNNFSITSVLYNNAYECGYYAVKERLRGHTRELLEGIVRPLGAIAGTLLLIVLQLLLKGNILTVAVNLLMIIIAVSVFYVIYRQQRKYTKLAVNDLVNSHDRRVRFNAVDMLAQRGHECSLTVLSKVIFDDNKPIGLRLRCVRALGDLNSVEAFSVLIKCLELSHPVIWDVALTSISSFRFLSSTSPKYLMFKYNLIVALKKIYSTHENSELNAKIIKLMAMMSNVAALEFLLDILNHPEKTDKNSAILALAGYRGDEVEAILVPYLKSRSIDESLSAALVLYNSKLHGDFSSFVVNKFLFSKNASTLAYGIFAIGELRLKKYVSLCEKYLNSKNKHLALASAIALAKMGKDVAVGVLVKFLFGSDEEFVSKVKREIRHIDVRILKIIDKIVRQRVQDEIEAVLKINGKNKVEKFEQKHLLHLKRLYALIEEYDEIEEINKLII